MCRSSRPASLAVDKVKLHYVVHYMNRGLWDHIVPEEGSKEGQIESYVCNACNRRFKNNLEKRSYPGRGSVLGHIATDHGRLLDVMLNDDKMDMTEEIQAIALYDKKFNELCQAYVDQGAVVSFELPDEEIVSIKESYLPKAKTTQKSPDSQVKAEKTDDTRHAKKNQVKESGIRRKKPGPKSKTLNIQNTFQVLKTRPNDVFSDESSDD